MWCFSFIHQNNTNVGNKWSHWPICFKSLFLEYLFQKSIFDSCMATKPHVRVFLYRRVFCRAGKWYRLSAWTRYEEIYANQISLNSITVRDVQFPFKFLFITGSFRVRIFIVFGVPMSFGDRMKGDLWHFYDK